MTARRWLVGTVAMALLLCAQASGATSGAARGANELWLNWNDCPNGGGITQRTFSCASTLGAITLVPSFVLSTTVDSVVAMEIVIDVVAADAVLPSWWSFQPGGCNAGSLSANADYSALGGCTDPWEGAGIAVAQAWWVGQPRGGANQARLIVSSAIPALAPARMDAAASYYAANIQIALAHATGISACAGCLSGACLVLNSIQLIRLPGSSPESVTIEPSGAGTSGWATWQNQAAVCGAVPVRNRTWGALKSLYR